MKTYRFWLQTENGKISITINADHPYNAEMIARAQYGADNITYAGEVW